MTAERSSWWSRLQRSHPELGPALVVGLSWAIFIVHGTRGWFSWAAPSGLGHWVLMTVVMMGPAALIGVRHTGMNSLCWRRRRAMAEFAVAYLSVWVGFGLLVLGGIGTIPRLAGREALAASLAAAAIWELTPYKGLRLRDCHRSIPLPPSGWGAERGAMIFGLRSGLACLGSCWCLMVVMVAAPGAHLLWTAALTGLVTAERCLERPRRITRWAAAGLGAAAIGHTMFG